MKRQTEVDGIIFDLDGTLLDTIADIAYAIEPVLASKGFEGHEIETYKEFVGHGLRNSLINALPLSHGLSEDEIEDLYTQMMRNYEASPYEHTSIYSGMDELLTWLQDRKVPVAILSNKDHALTQRIAAHRLEQFEFIQVQGLSVKYPGKPDPESAQAIAELMRCKPERLLFIGDSEVDFQTAVNAGMVPGIVSWGFRSIKELKRYVPESMIYDTPRQLLEVVTKRLGLD